MAGGMNIDTIPIPQQTPVEGQRQVVKTKTIGRTESEIPEESFKAKLEAQRQAKKQNQDKQESDEQAEKNRSRMLEQAGKMRHLRYEVIEDAAIVQVSVIDTEDGTVIRKVPPDKVVGLVQRMRQSSKAALGRSRLDIML